MNQTEIKGSLKELVKRSVSKGPVKLSSGKISDFYIDGRLVTLDPRGAFYTAVIMADMLEGIEFDAVGGPMMGADPIVGALCYHWGSLNGDRVTGFIIRKEAKGHGRGRLIEGPDIAAGSRVVIVEDVITSGASVLKAVAAVEKAGSQVVKILALVDREAGGAANLAAAGYDYQAIFSRRELV